MCVCGGVGVGGGGGRACGCVYVMHVAVDQWKWVTKKKVNKKIEWIKRNEWEKKYTHAATQPRRDTRGHSHARYHPLTHAHTHTHTPICELFLLTSTVWRFKPASVSSSGLCVNICAFVLVKQVKSSSSGFCVSSCTFVLVKQAKSST